MYVKNDAKINEEIGSVEATDRDGSQPGNIVKYRLGTYTCILGTGRRGWPEVFFSSSFFLILSVSSDPLPHSFFKYRSYK